MNFYRGAALFFVIGNVVLFTSFMHIASLPYKAVMIFLGYIYMNAPVLVSMYTAQKIDRTLKGHWLNWLNILIPVAVGTSGLVVYAKSALQPDAHPVIFLFGPLGITAVWFVLFGVLVMVYVFVPDR